MRNDDWEKCSGQPDLERRRLLRYMGTALGAVPVLGSLEALAAGSAPLIRRPIPSSGEKLPVVGLGSWTTFNVGNDRVLRDECTDVIRAFFERGGRMIDSSPMYGSSQEVIGYALAKLKRPTQLFSTDKVWTSSGSDGPDQIEETRRHWGVSKLDLLQVHNLLAWEKHLSTLFAMKAAERLRYVGVTTSHGRRHGDIEKIMRWAVVECKLDASRVAETVQ